MLNLWPRYLSYFVSFLVIGTYWVAHHAIFEVIQRFDRRLLWLQLLFLFFVALTPFPTAVLGEYGDYACGSGLLRRQCGGRPVWSRWCCTGMPSGPVSSIRAVSPERLRVLTRRGLVTPLVFLISIPFAFVHFSIPILLWVSTVVVYNRVDPVGLKVAG